MIEIGKVTKGWKVFGMTDNDWLYLERNKIYYAIDYKYPNPQNHYTKEEGSYYLTITTLNEHEESVLLLYFGERAKLVTEIKSAWLMKPMV